MRELPRVNDCRADLHAAHCLHPEYRDKVRRNVDAVRTGAMVKDAGMDGDLMRLRLIRVNRRTGWYDVTPAGRAFLDRVTVEVKR